MYAFSSFTYLFAMLSSNYALEFVSYPMQVEFIKIFFAIIFFFEGFRKISKTGSSYAFGCISRKKTISIRKIFLCFINCFWYEYLINIQSFDYYEYSRSSFIYV